MILARPTTLLHVEDQDLFHHAVEEGLEDAGVSVTLWRARDGTEALSILQDPALPFPDLILLDLFMHSMDGFEFLQRRMGLESFAAKVPVVILTTSRDEADMARARSLGVEPKAFFQKPIRYEELVGLLRQLGHLLAHPVEE
tara:strand:- start:1137 stop:1562 length:426 start_codon:yes stop_codon:yes gene_type:complete